VNKRKKRKNRKEIIEEQTKEERYNVSVGKQCRKSSSTTCIYMGREDKNLKEKRRTSA